VPQWTCFASKVNVRYTSRFPTVDESIERLEVT
jgi:hypothetical protein